MSYFFIYYQEWTIEGKVLNSNEQKFYSKETGVRDIQALQAIISKMWNLVMFGCF